VYLAVVVELLMQLFEIMRTGNYHQYKGPFGWGANLNGTVPFRLLRMEPLRSTFGKKNGAVPFFVWLESALE
jgi:hypothetical protein